MINQRSDPDLVRLRGLDRMFSEIAPGYDRGNRLVSWGWDMHFRRVLLDWEPVRGIGLDLCTGTGDLADMLLSRPNPPDRIIMLDVSLAMLQLARPRMLRRHPGGHWDLLRGDCEILSFPDESIDFITVGFALRNMRDLDRFGREMHRVLRPGGVVLMVDAAHPENRVWGRLFHFYFYKLVPFFSRFLTRRHAAYRYLAHSLRVHRTQRELMELFRGCGFAEAEYRNLLGGVTAVYRLRKKEETVAGNEQ